jgi:hypothetical protein
MEGHISGGTWMNPGHLFVSGKYKDADALRLVVLGNGETIGEALTNYDKITVYCTSGYGASRTFFALDAVLNANVQIYDGSMSQWMQYAAVATDDQTWQAVVPATDPATYEFIAGADTYDDDSLGGLPVGSPWSVEKLTDNGGDEGPAYNSGAPITYPTAPANGLALDKIEKVNYLTEEALDFPTPASVPNQVETADEEYMSSGGASTTPVGAFSDNGGVGC